MRYFFDIVQYGWVKNALNKTGIKAHLKVIEDADFRNDFQSSEKQMNIFLFGQMHH